MTASSQKLRVAIVDDEPIAREGVRTQLLRQRDVEIVAECGNGLGAVETIRELMPDLVFLDVQMPGMDGFEVVQTIGAEAMPAVVFVTAYDKYALQAFEVNAVDYLLKPFDSERFQKAFQRARLQIQRKNAETINQKLEALLQSMRPRERYLERLVELSSESSQLAEYCAPGEVVYLDRVDSPNPVRANIHVGRRAPRKPRRA